MMIVPQKAASIVPQKESGATEYSTTISSGQEGEGALRQKRPHPAHNSVAPHFVLGQLPRIEHSVKQSSLELTIDELILHDFSYVDRTELGAEVERALTRLFLERGTPSTFREGGDVDRLEGGTFTAQTTNSMHEIANQIAQAIYQGFGS